MSENPSKAAGGDAAKKPETAPVVQPVTGATNEPRSGGPGGPGGAQDTTRERELERSTVSPQDAQSIAERQMGEFNEQVRKGDASRYSTADVMARTLQDPPVYEVSVDSWGHTPEITRGSQVTQEDCPYDLAEAERRGVVRRLSIAEVRSQTPHPTMPLTVDGLAIDDALILAGRFHAGFRSPDLTGTLSDPQGNPVTVTIPSDVPPMPPEFDKPTLPGPENNTPAARPVITIEAGQDPRSAVDDFFADQERQAQPRNAESESAANRAKSNR